MANPVLTQRRSRRVPLWGTLSGELNSCCPAVIIDLSERGVQLEHQEIVRPGQLYVLQLVLRDLPEPLRLPARAIWSWVHHFEVSLEQPLVYRSGLEFQELSPEVSESLGAFLAAREAPDPSGDATLSNEPTARRPRRSGK